MGTQVGVYFTMIMLLFTTSVYAANVELDQSLMGDTAHFEFTGRDQWDYDLQKKTGKGQTFFEMRVPRMSDVAIKKIKGFRGGPVKSIEVRHGDVDQSDLIQINLAGQDVENFDYLTDQPSRLILDLYPAKKVVQAPAATPKIKAVASERKNASPRRKVATADVLLIQENPGEQVAAPAASEPAPTGIFDGSDPDFARFSIQDFEVREDSVIQSREKDYIDFPMLHLEPQELQVLNAKKPIYEIQADAGKDAKFAEENKMARLLYTLFMNKRYQVFLKTVQWFFDKYPDSKYDEIVRFMLADTHYALYQEDQRKNLGQFDLAMYRYREALHKYPKSPLAERTSLLMGYANLDRGDFLGTLRMFQQHLARLPDSANRDLARLAVAEAFLKLNQFDEASKVYDEIQKDGRRLEDRMRAAYLKGDVAFKKKDYPQAIANYADALKKYPQVAGEYPNALYNQGEALFRLKDFRASLQMNKDFLKRFASHPYAGYAMTRVGESLDILGADQRRVTGALLETYFRYGDQPSSTVARLRLAATRMKGMKPKEQEKVVADMQELVAKSDLPKIDQFATLLIADALTGRGLYDEATNLLVKYYRDHATTADTQRLSGKIVRNINDKIRDLTQNGKFLDALKTHDQYKDSWLKGTDRIDTGYWIGRSYEQAGVFQESNQLYRDTLNRVYAMQGSALGKERSVLEKIPKLDELHLRLGAVNFKQGQWAKAYDHLKAIEHPEALSEPEQIERVQMGAALLDKKGETDVALKYIAELLKNWQGVPALASDLYLDAGEMEHKLGKRDDAIKSFTRVDELMKDSGNVAPAVHAKALEKLADLQLSEKRPGLAIPIYERLLSGYEKTRPLESIRYKLGRLFFDRGDVQKAAEIWNDLKKSKSDFWFKLAQEQLKGSEWGGEYNKYIRRIPAMTEKDAK